MTPAPIPVPRRRPTTLLWLLLASMAPLALWPGEPVRGSVLAPRFAAPLPCDGTGCAPANRIGPAVVIEARPRATGGGLAATGGEPEMPEGQVKAARGMQGAPTGAPKAVRDQPVAGRGAAEAARDLLGAAVGAAEALGDQPEIASSAASRIALMALP